MSRRTGYLQTPTSLPEETAMFRIIPTCVPDGIWLISMTFPMFSQKGICLVTILLDLYLSRTCVICTISTV